MQNYSSQSLQLLLTELIKEFRNLAQESRKNDQVLLNVSERAVRKLRECQKLKILNLETLGSEIILQPLLMSWSAKKSLKFANISLNILQKLLRIQCISSKSFIQILISLKNLLSKSDTKIQIQIVQIIIQIPNTNTWIISRQFLKYIIYICINLMTSSKNVAVKSTSIAALQRILTVSLEQIMSNHNNNIKKKKNSQTQTNVRENSISVSDYKDPDIDDNNNTNNYNNSNNDNSNSNNDYNNNSNHHLSIFVDIFHDLICLASPVAYYLDDIHNPIATTSVSYTTMPLPPDNFNITNSTLDSNMNNMNSSLTIYDSKLKLLDIDFEINNVPVWELIEVLVTKKEFHLSLQYGAMLNVVQSLLCPLICEMINRCNNFEEMMKVAKLTAHLINEHYLFLNSEVYGLISELLRLLEPNSNKKWKALIVLEVLRHLLKCSYLLKFFYVTYDMNSTTEERLFGSLIHGLGRFMHQISSISTRDTKIWSPKRLDKKYFTFVKDSKTPPTSSALQISLSILCLISFVEGLALVCNVSSAPNTPPNSKREVTSPKNNKKKNIHNTLNDDNSVMFNSPSLDDLNENLEISRNMIEVIWRPLLAILSQMLNHSIYEAQFQQLLSMHQTLSRICGKLSLIKPLESFLRSMSQHALPQKFIRSSFSDILTRYTMNSNVELSLTSSNSNNDNNNNSITSNNIDILDDKKNLNEINNNSGSNLLNVNNNNQIILLSIKNVCTIHALVNIAHGLGNILGNAWSVLLECFEKLDFIFHRLKYKLVNNNNESINKDSHWFDEIRMLDSRLLQLFESSKYLDDNSLGSLLTSLGHLVSSSLAGIATTLSDKNMHTNTRQRHIISNDNRNSNDNKLNNKELKNKKHNTSKEQVKAFALRKFDQTILVNIMRIDKYWDNVYAHLHLVITSTHPVLREFGLNCLTKIQLKALTTYSGFGKLLITDNEQEIVNSVYSDNNNKPKKLNKSEQNKREKFQKILLSPSIKLIKSKHIDVRELVIKGISELLQNAGQYISEGWPTIVELLHHVSSNNTNNNKTSIRNDVSLSCLKMAFKDLRLISEEFLDCLPDYCVVGLIQTVGLYGKQRNDANLAYSAINLLWRIADYITLSTKATKENEMSVNKHDNDKNLIDVVRISDGLQLKVIQELKDLCIDSRPDVRNSALQSCHSALVSYGDNLREESWPNFISILKFILKKVVIDKVRYTSSEEEKLKNKIGNREYRNLMKKMNQSEIHCLQGGSRIIKTFINILNLTSIFKEYWKFYLNTLVKLIDLNPTVAISGILSLQELAQSQTFIKTACKNIKYWNDIVRTYQIMIHSVSQKEIEKFKLVNVFDTLMNSVKELLNPSLSSRKLFTLKQIELILNSLDYLCSDNNFDILSEPLYKLDNRLIRLRNILSIYEQLPPLSPKIAKIVINKLTNYLSYIEKCCHCYQNYILEFNKNKNDNKNNQNNQNTIVKITNMSLLKKIEKTMSSVIQNAITLLLVFYSIDIPNNLKAECFEMVVIGISKVINPFICPIDVVMHAIKGFEDVCKVGLPNFSKTLMSPHSMKNDIDNLIINDNNSNEQNNEINEDNINLEEYENEKVTRIGQSLRIWSVLGDIISITFRLQEQKYYQTKNELHKKNKNSIRIKINSINIDSVEQTKNQEKLIDVKIRILNITMKYILPYAHFAPISLKRRIILLLSNNSSCDGNDINNNYNGSKYQRETRLNQSCIQSLFQLCNDTVKISQKYDSQLSAMAYALLIPKIADIFDRYIEDEISSGNHRPLPLFRQQQVLHILKLLKNLKVNPQLDIKSQELDISNLSIKKKLLSNGQNNNNKNSNDNNNGSILSGIFGWTSSNGINNDSNNMNNNNNNNNINKSRLSLYNNGVLTFTGKTKTRPHLFRLYPILCRLIKVRDINVKTSLCQTFETLGIEMGCI